jgi:hypothetical protein
VVGGLGGTEAAAMIRRCWDLLLVLLIVVALFVVDRFDYAFK